MFSFGNVFKVLPAIIRAVGEAESLAQFAPALIQDVTDAVNKHDFASIVKLAEELQQLLPVVEAAVKANPAS